MSEKQITIQKPKNFKFGALLLAMTAITAMLSTAAHAQVVKGNGTPGTVPVWTSNATIGNSIVSQSGGNINVNGGVKASGTVTAPNFSGSFFGNGTGLSNVNASLLGGLGPGGFAQLGSANTFTADQAITGNLTLGGSFNNTLTLQNDLMSNGEESSNVIGGFGSNNTLPGNSVASGVVGATIAGGGGALSGNLSVANTVTVAWGTIGGGAGNVAGGRFAVVGGGIYNTANGFQGSVVAGGQGNASSGLYSTVSGGFSNVASGQYSTVSGGLNNIAGGRVSFAAGNEAKANSIGSFVWSDSTAGGASDIGTNSFVARASGGFAFYTAPGTATGAYLPAGSGSWASLSDRSVKANLIAVNGHAILERLASLPIATWNYKAQSDSVRHMGPMAQDFREAFGLGEDEKHISAVDSEGVALAAIQALYREKQQLQERLEALESRLASLESSK